MYIQNYIYYMYTHTERERNEYHAFINKRNQEPYYFGSVLVKQESKSG